MDNIKLTYYERNKEIVLLKAKEYYKKNRHIINERQKKYFREVYYPRNKLGLIKKIYKNIAIQNNNKPVYKNKNENKFIVTF